MMTIIVCNILLILLLGLLGVFFAPEHLPRWLVGYVVASWATGVSVTAWIIYVVYHFVTKYW